MDKRPNSGANEGVGQEKEPLVEKKDEEHALFQKLLSDRRQDNVQKCVRAMEAG